MQHERLAHPEVLALLRDEYEARAREAETAVGRLHMEKADLRNQEVRDVRRQLLLVQKEQLIESLHQRLLTQRTYETLLSTLNAEAVRLEASEDASPASPTRD
jgi:hypothetical protein